MAGIELRVDSAEALCVAQARHLTRFYRRVPGLAALIRRRPPSLAAYVAALAVDDRRWEGVIQDFDYAHMLAEAVRQGSDVSGCAIAITPGVSRLPRTISEVVAELARRVARINERHDSAVRRAVLMAHQLARAGRGDGEHVAVRRVLPPNTAVPAPPLPFAG